MFEPNQVDMMLIKNIARNQPRIDTHPGAPPHTYFQSPKKCQGCLARDVRIRRCPLSESCCVVPVGHCFDTNDAEYE